MRASSLSPDHVLMRSRRLSVLALSVFAILILPNVTAQTSKDTIFVKKAVVGLAWNGVDFIASYGENTSSLLKVIPSFNIVLILFFAIDHLPTKSPIYRKAQ